MTKLLGIGALVITMLLAAASGAIAREPPVAKLVQVEGKVEYSRSGARWRPIRRTKYLFVGYRIRTGSDGSGKIVNQSTGATQALGSNSEIEVATGGITKLSGKLTAPKIESGSIFEGLANKFAKAQRYTTVRRGVDKPCNNKVKTIRAITVSSSHPDLVWRNACPEYSYRLVVEGNAHDVPAEANSEMIRFSIADMPAGTYSYKVEVMDNDGIVYNPRKESQFTILDKKSDKKIARRLQAMGDDVFVRTDLLEQEGLHVAVMDSYREYFLENPDDNDMRPLLIQAYSDLKLTNLKDNEARLYNAVLEEDF
jgi:hypothetical protein